MRVAGPSDVFTDQPDVEPALEPIPLPPLRASQRRRRRAAQTRERRRQGATLGLATLIAIGLVLAALAVDRGAVTLAHRHRAAVSAPPKVAGSAVAQLPFVLAQTNGAGDVQSVTVLAPAARRGGTILLVPPGTMTEVPSLGLQPLTQAMEDGGIDRLVSTVENLLGIRTGAGAPANGATLAQMVEPAAPLMVDVPSRVEDVAPSGAVTVRYERGPNQLAATDVAPFLAARGRGTDLTRLARHDALWRAWLARLKGHPERLPSGPPELRKALATLAAGEVQVRLLPVQSVGTIDGEGELYQPEPSDIRQLIAATFPASDVPAASRPRVRVLNGTGQLEVATRVSDKLVPAGIEVVLTGNADRFSYAQTQIVYYRDSKLAMAQAVQRALGVGILVRNRNATDVVDVTVIVGKDFKTG